MSVLALEQAVLAQLRVTVVAGGMGYDKTNSGIHGPEGKPPPSMGSFYAVVHGSSVSNDMTTCLEEVCNLNITLSFRIEQPMDRIGSDLIDKASLGLRARAEGIRAMMGTQRYTVMNAANVIIGVSTATGFCEPLYFLNYSDPILVGPDWFTASSVGKGYRVGLRMPLRFGKARRVQYLEAAS